MTRILVVDDEAAIAELAEAILLSEGYEVEAVCSGREALASVKGNAFQLVLLDVMMPEIDGCAVFKKLKADPRTRDIPVVLMSASDRLSSIAAELRPESSLQKPFSLDDLLECVAHYALTPDPAACLSS